LSVAHDQAAVPFARGARFGYAFKLPKGRASLPTRARTQPFAGDAQPPALRRQGPLVRPVDHRLAPGMPALPSAPERKSFSIASWPILACNFPTIGDRSGSAASAP
jgi:hypothetical protein